MERKRSQDHLQAIMGLHNIPQLHPYPHILSSTLSQIHVQLSSLSVIHFHSSTISKL